MSTLSVVEFLHVTPDVENPIGLCVSQSLIAISFLQKLYLIVCHSPDAVLFSHVYFLISDMGL